MLISRVNDKFQGLILLLILFITATGDDLDIIAIFEGNPSCDSTYFGIGCYYLGDINADGYGDLAIFNETGIDTLNCPRKLRLCWGGP